MVRNFLVISSVCIGLFWFSVAFGGFLIKIEGQLVKQNEDYVILKSRDFRYKVNKPSQGSKAFLLSKKGENNYVLKVDHTLIVQKRKEARLPAEDVPQKNQKKIGDSK